MGILQKIRQELLAKYCAPSPEPRPPQRDIERAEIITACAMAFVLKTDKAHLFQGVLREFLPADRILLPSHRQIQLRGGVSGIYQRIREGGLGMRDRLGVWNPDFWHGLRLSGALRRGAGRSWDIWARTHQELIRDLEELPHPNRMERKTGRNGVRRLRRCPLSHLPSDDPSSDSVLAGLFAGGVLKRVAGEDWLWLPDLPEIRGLLDDRTIAFEARGAFGGRSWLAVSPFFAALYAHLMPEHSAQRILNLKSPARCPFLPTALWDWAMSSPMLRWMPFPGALPFGCTRWTAHRRGWKRRDLHRRCISEVGITHVDRQLRNLMVRWFEEERQKRRSIALLPAAAAPETPVPLQASGQ